jgi:hypothetical protein
MLTTIEKLLDVMCGPRLIRYSKCSERKVRDYFFPGLLVCNANALCIIDTVLFALQNPADLEKIRGLRSELCPAYSRDAYQAISIKAEVPSDAEAEVDPLSVTSPGIKAEPEVSCVSVSTLGRIH